MVRFRRPAPSGNVEDRRGSRIPGGAAGAGGIGGVLLLLLLVGASLMGVDVGGVFQGAETPIGPVGQTSPLSAGEEQQLADFSAQVLGDTEAT